MNTYYSHHTSLDMCNLYWRTILVLTYLPIPILALAFEKRSVLFTPETKMTTVSRAKLFTCYTGVPNNNICFAKMTRMTWKNARINDCFYIIIIIIRILDCPKVVWWYCVYNRVGIGFYLIFFFFSIFFYCCLLLNDNISSPLIRVLRTGYLQYNIMAIAAQ